MRNAYSDPGNVGDALVLMAVDNTHISLQEITAVGSPFCLGEASMVSPAKAASESYCYGPDGVGARVKWPTPSLVPLLGHDTASRILASATETGKVVLLVPGGGCGGQDETSVLGTGDSPSVLQLPAVPTEPCFHVGVASLRGAKRFAVFTDLRIRFEVATLTCYDASPTKVLCWAVPQAYQKVRMASVLQVSTDQEPVSAQILTTASLAPGSGEPDSTWSSHSVLPQVE